MRSDVLRNAIVGCSNSRINELDYLSDVTIIWQYTAKGDKDAILKKIGDYTDNNDLSNK